MKSTIPICYQIYDSLCTYTAFHGAEGNTQKTTLNWICILFSRKKAKLHFSSVQAKKYEQSSNHTHIIPRFVLVIHTAILWYNSSVRLPLQGWWCRLGNILQGDFCFWEMLAAVRSVCLLVVFFIHPISLAFETTTFLSCCWLTGCYAFSSHAFGFLFVVVLAFFENLRLCVVVLLHLFVLLLLTPFLHLRDFLSMWFYYDDYQQDSAGQVVSGIELSSVRPSVALRRYLSYWESVCVNILRA